LLLLLLPCSAAETTGFELSSLTNSQESWIFQNGNFYFSENILFSILLQLGTFLASCRPVVLCSPVLFWRASAAPNHESYLYYSTTSQYSVIHHMFFVQSCTRPIYLSSLSQSKFPITSCVYHSGPQWLQAFPALKKMAWSPASFSPTFIISYQSMKWLQESTLQGCHKRNSFDHSCTLRRVYISILLQ
jgi:hypothetical protein